MKKKNILITLTSTMALLCIGGAFALNAGNSVSAETPSQQKMLGASILVANDKTGIDSNGIRFPVVVADEVAEKITESKVYVLPKDHWEGVEAPTAEQVKANGTAFDTTEKWVNYYEQDTGYGDEYSEAVVYMYNIPTSKYATDFYVCSQLTLEGGATDTSEVIGRSMTYVAQKAVESGAYSTDDLGNYIQATYNVNKYLRTVYGSYELTGESTTVEGVAGEIPTVDGVDGYTINATLTAQANPELYDGATLNFYYENNDYTFESQELGNSDANLTLEKRVMKGVTAENMRGNTYYYSKSKNDGGTQNKFTYDNSVLGKYLMLNVYYISTWSSEPGMCFEAWSIDGGKGHVTKDILVKSYDDEGKIVQGSVIDYATSGNWVTIALYMDPVALGADSTSCYFTFTHWTKNELYIGEYIYLTQEQFDEFYEKPPYKASEVVEDAYLYEGDGLVKENNVLSLDGVTSYSAGSLVAVTASNSVGAKIKMYANDSEESFDAEWIYTENGELVAEVSANATYTYVFYMDSAITVGEKAGKMFVDTAVAYTINYDTAYTMNNWGFSRLRYHLFEKTDGVQYFSAYDITRVEAGNMQVTDVKDGTRIIIPDYSGKDRLVRRFTLDGVKQLNEGDHIVVKAKFEKNTPWIVFHGLNQAGKGTSYDWWSARAAFAEDGSVIDNQIATHGNINYDELKKHIGKYVYLVYRLPKAITVGSPDAKCGAIGIGNNLGDDYGKEGGAIQIGAVYIMNQTGFNTYFRL